MWKEGSKMQIEEKLVRIKEQIASNDEQKAQEEGALKQLQKRLTEYGYSNLEEAVSEGKKLQKMITDLDDEIENEMDQIRERYDV